MEASISILVPVRNGLPYIQECIESVYSQNYQNWELLVSDNGSTDGTLDYLDSLRDKRVRVFKQPKNLGIMGNVNFLFSQANAPLSQILCADDYFLTPGSLDTIIDYWKYAAARIGLVVFNYYGPSRKKIRNAEQGVPAVIHPDQADLWFFTCGCISSNLSSVSLRTRLVDEAGRFDENLPFAGDFEFWTRAARRVSLGVQKEQIVCVRRHEQVASKFQNMRGELYVQQIFIYEKLIEGLSVTYSKRKLVDFFNYEICSFHYRTAVKLATQGNFNYLKQLLSTNSPILWPKWRQLMICLPIALLNIRERLTDHMSEKIINDQLGLYSTISENINMINQHL